MKSIFTNTIIKTCLLVLIILTPGMLFSTARSWVGVGAGGSGTDFNTGSNWNPSGVPASADDLTINMSSSGTVTLSGSITVNSITMSVTGSNIVGVLDILTNTLTINAASSFSASSGNTNTRGILHAGTSPGKIIFNADVTFNPSGDRLFKFRADGTNPGSYVFMTNVTTGSNAFTEPGDEPQFIFDKAGSQSWTFNSTSQYIVPESIIVGQSNTPTVSFIGSGSAGLLNIYNGGLTVNANCTLDIGKFAVDKLSSTGALTLGVNSFLKIGATQNFPTGFSTYSIDITNTVEYYGTSSTQNIGAMPGVDSYGNLTISGSGSKEQTSVGGITVRGNLTINSGSTYYAYQESTTVNGTTTNNGTYNASTAEQFFKENFINNGTWTQGTTSTSIATFSGTAAQTVSGTTTTTAFQRMTMNNTSATGVTLNTPIEVIAVLTLTDGVIYTDAINLLSLRDNCTSTSGSNASHVDGPMMKVGNDAFAFPVGDAGVWARIGMSAPGNTADNFTAQYFFSPASPATPVASTIQYIGQVEYWVLDRTNGTSNVTVTLYWEDGVRSGINTFSNDLHVARWDGSIWQDHGSGTMTGGVSAGTLATSSAVTSFSPFTFSSSTGANPLPVELLYFNANCRADNIELIWETASEQDNKKFRLYKSYDGISYEEIAQYDGAGNSNTPVLYNHIDQLESFITYYKLAQQDGNGILTFYEPVSVNCVNNEYDFYVYSEPDEIFLVVNASEKSYISMELYDISGKLMNAKKVECEKGINKFSLNKNEISSGIYFIRMVNGTNSYSQKIIVD